MSAQFELTQRMAATIERLRYENRLLTQKLERRDARIERLYRQLRQRMTGGRA